MAKKLPGLQRVLDVPSLAAVAYGEIASSLYFALGVIALYALGFTPWVLLAVGLLFLVVALSYAEGTTAIPEPGGAATFVRRAFNDPAGFLTGWALILDYLIVMALAGLFVPHYLGHAIGWEGLTDEPWDTVVGVLVILTVGALRLVRRTSLYRTAILVAGVALATHLLLVGLGFAFLFSTDALTVGVDLGTAPTWSDIAFALPVAMLAYTGLETVANLAAETREPGRTLPRSLFAGIGLVVAVSVAIGVVGISAFPGGTGLATEWLRAPLMGITAALDAELPAVPGDALRIIVGLTGVVVLLVAVTTSISGAGRLAYSMGQRADAPACVREAEPPDADRAGLDRELHADRGGAARDRALHPDRGGALPRRPVQLRRAARVHGRPAGRHPAALHRAGPRPALPGAGQRPNPRRRRARSRRSSARRSRSRSGSSRWRRTTRPASPAPPGSSSAPLVYVGTRWSRHKTIFGRVLPADPDLVPEVEGVYERILVPMKLGLIGEEVLATAIRLAEERQCALYAIHVVSVPMDKAIDDPMHDAEERAEASLAEAKLLASEHGVEVEAEDRPLARDRRGDRRRGRRPTRSTSSSWARRRAGGASPVSSAPRSTTSCATRRAR